MIFSENDLSLNILDVMEFESKRTVCYNKKRNYCALSLRIKADTQILWSGKSLKLSDGSLTFFPSGIGYTRKCEYDSMIVIHLDIPNYVSYDIQTATPNNYQGMYDIFKNMLTIWTQKKPGYKYAASALLYRLFEMLCLEFSDTAAVPDSIKGSLDFIHENYTDCQIRMSDIVKNAGMSEVYFRKIFKSCFGVTPKRYITDLRMEHAKTLLNSGHVTVSEAAERSGFGDVKHFSTAFKKKMGYPPSKQEYNSK